MKVISKFLGFLFAAIFLGWCVFPIFWVITTAFKPRIDMFRLPPRWIFKPTLDNFRFVFEKMPVEKWLLNSILISCGTMSLSLVIGVPAGYALARGTFRGKKLVYAILLLVRAIPPIVLILPFRAIVQWLGLYGTRTAVILLSTVLDASFTAWLMSSMFENVPVDLEEAALIDGCSPIRVLYRVAIPLSKPGLVTAALFAFILSWNDFLFALALTSPETATLPLGMLSTYGILQQGWTYMMALGCIAIFPVLLISLMFQKYYISGLCFGGIK